MNAIAPVMPLLQPSRPPAIVRFVIAIVVDPIKRKFVRWMAHISKEVFKVEPSFTDADPALAVVLPVWNIWISAPSQHGAPDTVNLGAPHAVRCASASLPATATGLAVTPGKVTYRNCNLISAVAAAEPISSTALREGWSYCREALKAAVCEISRSVHVGNEYSLINAVKAI